MSDFDKHSRVNKFEKRRKNTKSISIFIIIGVILVIILLGIWIFGGNDKEADESQSETNAQKEDGQADDNSDDFVINEDNNEDNATTNNEDDESDDQDVNEEENDSENDEVDTEETNTDDKNVKKAYKGDWDPIETSQSEPHEVQYDAESQDWKEMEKAIKYATGLNDMTIQRIRNGGDQKVIGTVTSPDSTIYRVYLSWKTNEGWQPTQVELLKELDENEW